MEPENKVEYVGDRVCRVLPASGKIYDITEADTAEHSVALPAGYPANTRAIQIRAERVTGTGTFQPRSVSGQTGFAILNNGNAFWIRAADGLFYYNLGVANDDWDILAQGYITG